MIFLLKCSPNLNLLLENPVLLIIITAIFGILSSFFIDYIKGCLKTRKNKDFIKSYLKNTILPELTEINNLAVKFRDKIKNHSSDNFLYSAFENFDGNVLKSIKPSEYYDDFGKDYFLLNEIISMVDFLSNNQFEKINNRYFDSINKHLREKNKVGDIEHLRTCSYCKDQLERTILLIDARMDNVKDLTEKIKTFIDKV